MTQRASQTYAHVRFSTCQDRRNPIWSDIIKSITQTTWVRSRRLIIYVCDLIEFQLLDVSQKSRCCQLSVLTSPANRSLSFFFFFFAPVATPKKRLFQRAPARHQQACWRIAPELNSHTLSSCSPPPQKKSFVPVFI